MFARRCVDGGAGGVCLVCKQMEVTKQLLIILIYEKQDLFVGRYDQSDSTNKHRTLTGLSDSEHVGGTDDAAGVDWESELSRRMKLTSSAWLPSIKA